MRNSASKIILLLALAVTAYGMWDQLVPSGLIKQEASAKTRELTPEVVNRTATFALRRDPFVPPSPEQEVVLVPDPIPMPVLPAATQPQIAAPVVVALTPRPRPLPPPPQMTLQAIVNSRNRRNALINGRLFTEGQLGELVPKGPVITARQIGVDWALVEVAGQMVTLRMRETSLDIAIVEVKGSGDHKEVAPPTTAVPLEVNRMPDIASLGAEEQ